METLMDLGKFSLSSTTNYLYSNSSSGGSPEQEYLSDDGAATPPPPPPPPSLHSSSPHFEFVPTSASSLSFSGNPVQEPKTGATAPFFPSTFGTKYYHHHHELSFENPLHKGSNMDAMREMIFRIAMMQPVHIDPESVKPPRRKNVKISRDPQSVAARHRRERISEKIRILQRLVPGGTKMDTASMLDEAAHYLKFLKKQVKSLEQTTTSANLNENVNAGGGINPMMITMAAASSSLSSSSMNVTNLVKSCQHQHAHMVGSMQMLSFGS